jgi:acyl carrier protein
MTVTDNMGERFMRRLLTALLTLSLVTAWLVPAAFAQSGAAVERLRTELAKILKKDPAQLPVDKPVTAFGADDLSVVEWQMAAEKAFRVDISDDKLFDPKANGATRTDLTITSMAAAVATGKPWPAGKTK